MGEPSAAVKDQQYLFKAPTTTITIIHWLHHQI